MDATTTAAAATAATQAASAATPAAAPAAAAPAAAAAAAAAPAAHAVATQNPYGLIPLWVHGSVIDRGILVLLAVMSLYSWFIIFVKLWDQYALGRAAKQVDKSFWGASSLKEGIDKLKKADDFRFIAETGMRAASHHEGRLTDHVDLHEWVTMSLQRAVDAVSSKMSSGLTFLATTGSTAPFIGLAGTVIGVLNALIAIGVSGQASIDRVAGPVGEALIMTAMGLFVAVPAVLGYNWLLRRNKLLLDNVRGFASDLHAYLMSGARVGIVAPVGPQTAPSASGAKPAAVGARVGSA